MHPDAHLYIHRAEQAARARSNRHGGGGPAPPPDGIGPLPGAPRSHAHALLAELARRLRAVARSPGRGVLFRRG